MGLNPPYRSAPIVHINGWQGSGKRTIATQLAARTGARLLDNHSLLSIAQSLFDRGTPDFIELRQKLRDLAFKYALTLPPKIPLILTDAFSTDTYEKGLFAQVKGFASERDAPLVTILLDIDEAENARRISTPNRLLNSKLTDPDILATLRQNHKLLHHDTADIRLDVTQLTAVEAAEQLHKALFTKVRWG